MKKNKKISKLYLFKLFAFSKSPSIICENALDKPLLIQIGLSISTHADFMGYTPLEAKTKE